MVPNGYVLTGENGATGAQYKDFAVQQCYKCMDSTYKLPGKLYVHTVLAMLLEIKHTLVLATWYIFLTDWWQYDFISSYMVAENLILELAGSSGMCYHEW